MSGNDWGGSTPPRAHTSMMAVQSRLLATPLLVVCCGWSFQVQVSTAPELLATAFYWFGPYETREECQAINNGARFSGAFKFVGACEEY